MPKLPMARLVLHLLVGLCKCALLFPWLGSAGREQRVQRWSQQLIAICGVKLVLRNVATKDAGGAVVSPGLIISNHVSWLDIFVINSVHPCHFVAKSDIRDWPLIGWLCEKTGTIFIARGRQRDVRRIYAGLVRSIHNGDRVAFFPEGTTATQGTVLPFHANLFEAAIEAQVPVQPYALRYLDDDGALHAAADFIGEMTFAESVAVILRNRRLTAELIRLPAISSEGAHRRDLAQAAHSAIKNALTPVVDIADNPPVSNCDPTAALP